MRSPSYHTIRLLSALNSFSVAARKPCRLLAFLCLTVGLAAGRDQSPGTDVKQTPVATYQVRGSAQKSTVWYIGPDGERSVERVDLPWARDVPAGEDAVLFVRAGREPDGPGVKVSLSINSPETAEESSISRTAVANGNVTVAGVLRSPADTNRVQYIIENTCQTVDSLRRTITGLEGEVVDTFTRPDSLAPGEHLSEADRLQPDTTVALSGTSRPSLTLEAFPPTSESIGAIGMVYAWPVPASHCSCEEVCSGLRNGPSP